jgi:hypothetical protein
MLRMSGGKGPGQGRDRRHVRGHAGRGPVARGRHGRRVVLAAGCALLLQRLRQRHRRASKGEEVQGAAAELLPRRKHYLVLMS